MICGNCGKENKKDVKFCTECGTKLEKETIKQNTTSKKVEKSNNKYVALLLENLNNLKDYLLKPLDSLKNTYDIKEVAITGGILAVAMMLVNLIMTMLSSLRTMTMDWTGKISYSWSFSRLDNLDYVGLIFKNLFVYAGIMLIIAAIFYVGSLIIKKEVKYTKILSIVFISALPLFLGNVVVATILGLIYSQLAVVAAIISTIYSICIFAQLINNEMKLDGMKKIYYNVGCFSVVAISGYFVLMNMLSSSISSYLNIF